MGAASFGGPFHGDAQSLAKNDVIEEIAVGAASAVATASTTRELGSGLIEANVNVVTASYE